MISLNVRRVVCDGVRDPEVNELQLPFDKDEVGRLEIRVHNLLVVNDLDSLKHLHLVQAGAIRSASEGIIQKCEEVIGNGEEGQTCCQ